MVFDFTKHTPKIGDIFQTLDDTVFYRRDYLVITHVNDLMEFAYYYVRHRTTHKKTPTVFRRRTSGTSALLIGNIYDRERNANTP